MIWACPSIRPSVHPSICLSVTLAHGQEWLELGSWNFINNISMKNKGTCMFFIFLSGSPYGVIPLFRLRYLTADGGYLVWTTPHTVIYPSIWNFSGSFAMVCRCSYGFGIMVNLIFVTFFRLLKLAISVHLSAMLCIQSRMVRARSLKYYI